MTQKDTYKMNDYYKFCECELFGNVDTEINVYCNLDTILEMENWIYEKF